MDNLRFGVEECRGGTPVSVARLTDGAGIDQVTSVRPQLQTGRLSLAYRAVFGAKPVGRIIQKKSALEMRMAKKCNQRRRRHEGCERIRQRNNIFIFIEGRPVDQLHLSMIFQRKWPWRQSLQPLPILLG